MKKKYIIFDFDWTLVDSKTKEFFDGVVEMIERLAKDYTLFISSRSMEDFLKQKLKSVWIYDYFEVVFGSGVIEKWPKHIETFDLLIWEDDFSEKTIFVWDWEIDRELAKETWLIFVKVWKESKDYYEIEKTTDLEKLLPKIK